MFGKKCYVIAEIGNNHCGEIDLCIKTIKEAKISGASAVKLQKRSNRDLFTQKFYQSSYENPNSYGKTYGEHRNFLELSNQEMIQARKCAKEIGIDFICTPFDNKSVDFLSKYLELDAWKIASADLRNRQLQDRISETSTKKIPIIFSTGGYTLEDGANTANYLKDKFEEIAILHCISSYPTKPSLVNLNCIKTLKKALDNNVHVGYSSHDNGIAISLAARVIGAEVIEKHFTLDRSLKGTDHAMSANPTMLRKLVRDLDKIDQSMGSGIKDRLEEEEKPLIKMIKSPYTNKELNLGDTLQKFDINFKVPFTGIDFEDAKSFVGKTLKRKMKVEEPIKFKDLE